MWGPVTDCGILETSEKADQGKCCSSSPKGMNIQKDKMNIAEIQQQHKGLRPETGATSEKQEDII
jgi:hypothetical protein